MGPCGAGRSAEFYAARGGSASCLWLGRRAKDTASPLRHDAFADEFTRCVPVLRPHISVFLLSGVLSACTRVFARLHRCRLCPTQPGNLDSMLRLWRGHVYSKAEAARPLPPQVMDIGMGWGHAGGIDRPL